jgi:ribonuclease T2
MPKDMRGLIGLLVLAIASAAGLYQLFAQGGPAPQAPSAMDTQQAPEGQAEPVSAPGRIPDGPISQAPGVIAEANVAGLPISARTPKGDFDYYILALSWSPTYCLEEADPQRDRRQCQSARPFAFVLHGLWPQHERGYPERCETRDPRVPDAIIDTVMDIMPSRGLAGHQWRKHGACTGLSQADYFSASRAAFSKVRIPSEFVSVGSYVSTSPAKVEQAFLAANPGLKAAGVTVTCSRKHLREVRVCLTKDLQFRACGADVARDCSLGQVVMPPSRGGR